jgi:hypothetical protein
MTDGGDGQSKGYCPSKEARIKTSLSLKGRIVSKETRLKISRKHKNKNIPSELRSRISNSLRGRFAGNKNPNFGKHHSEEIKEKSRLLNLGKKPLNRKLNDVDVLSIRKLYSNGKTLKYISQQFNISVSTTQNITSGKYYNTVTCND